MSRCKFDGEGNLLPMGVNIVWGSPASGKTTYVKKHMEEGDMVVDLDLIKQSISLKTKTECNDNLLSTAIMIREMLYDLIRKREVDCNNVWVVAGLPKQEERDALETHVRATQIIFIEATQEECIARAMNDNERKDKAKQLEVIEKWFKQFYYEP